MADIPRGTAETNPIVKLFARLAAAVETREREAIERRRTIRRVQDERRGGTAA